MNRKISLLFILAVCFLSSNRLGAEDKLPNREERLYSLSLIWKEMLYNFAFPEELQQVNIDSLYMAYIPKMEQVKSEYEYYRTLCSFMAHFNDAHTRIIADPRPDDTPPLTATNFGEKIIVNGIAESFADKIPLGSEILQIDHIPVITYLTDSVYPYTTASTPQWKLDKAVTEMLYGEPQSTVTLTIKTPKGKMQDVKMIRNYNSSATKVPMLEDKQALPINIRIIDNNIGYIQLTSFMGQYLDTINTTFNDWLPELRKCKGLIIDIRGNRGGTDEAWNNIAFYLIHESQFQEKGKWFSRINNACYKNWGKSNPQLKDYFTGTAMTEIKHSFYTNDLNDSLKLNQPLIIISGQMVASASENFLELMKEYKRALVLGEASVGAVSEPTYFPLPGKLNVMISVKKYIPPDGQQLNETGILPDIEVKRDYNAYLQGKDNILERAIEELQISAYAQEKFVFSKEELVSDFKYLYSSMEKDHPDLFAYLPESDYQENKMQVFNSIQDSMSVEKFYLLVAPFVASLKNGHMNVSIPIASRIQFLNNGGLAFPLKVNIADDRLFVSVDLSKEQNVPVNAEILSINGISASDILKKMFCLMGSEINNEIKYSAISNYFSTLLWYMYRFENDYQLSILENDNKKDIHLQGITQKQYTEMMNSKKTFQNNQNLYDFRIDSLKNTAYLKIRSFADADKLSEFLKNSFQQLLSYHTDSLIIDVRDNGGGSSSSVDSLMNYLTNKPFKQYNKILLKVSEDVKNIYKERHPDIYNEIINLSNGQFYIFDNALIEPRQQSITYSGKVIAYVNYKTYSGASTFASLIDCLHRGTIIGCTGSPKIYCADFLQFKMPYTQIEYTIPVKKFYDCGTD